MDKYWNSDLDVTIIGYKKPNFDLCNWKFYSLGDVDRGPCYWVFEMLDFFSKVDDEFFIYWNEDRPIIRPINMGLFNDLMSYLEDNIGRIGLTKDIQTMRFEHYKTINNHQIIKLKNDAFLRNSLMCSIWNRNYFLMSLEIYKKSSNSFNAGIFERNIDNKIDLCRNSKGETYEILGSLDKHVFQLVNLYRKDHNSGKFPGDFERTWFKDDYSDDEMYQDDRDEIFKLIEKYK